MSEHADIYPDLIAGVVRDLRAVGFQVVAERGTGDFNWVTELRQGLCGVLISADRSQWSIELGGSTLEDWFDAAVWEACLDDKPVDMEPTELARQASFALRRWRDVDRALGSAGSIRECLVRTRSLRARTRLGLAPTED